MANFPHELRPGQLIRDWANELRAAVLAVLVGGTGITVKRDGEQVVLSADIDYLRQRINTTQPRLRWFKVSGSSDTGVNDANGNPVQWTYTVAEVYKATAGYGGWSTLSGGVSGTAYNGAEEGNDGSGRQMNGVDHDGADYPSSFQMRPLQNNSIVPGYVIKEPGTDTVEIWLMPWSNGEDGACS